MASDVDSRRAQRARRNEGLCVLAHAALYPFGFRRSSHRTPRAADRRTLVFVHGLGANRSSFFALQAYLRLSGFRDQLATSYRPRGSIEALALQLKRTIDDRVRGGRIDLIAHSMGGLVARFYAQHLGGARRADRLVTLGTPHRGSYGAARVPSDLVRQLDPESAFLRRLNASPPPAGLQITSIAAGRDALVQPGDSALCPHGEQHTFSDLGHLGLLFSPRVYAVVGAALVRGAALDVRQTAT
jgi:triacylglycerol esterase/lipase EstA (alpha/beta hydrolase family)